MTAVVQCVVSAGDSGDKYGCQYTNVILKHEICCTLLGLICQLFQPFTFGILDVMCTCIVGCCETHSFCILTYVCAGCHVNVILHLTGW
jgi:hypothetical protein